MSELRMPAINQVSLSGRLAQDPEFRFTESGVARLSARLAVNRSYRDRNDEWQEESSFFNLVAWHKVAEYASDRLKKGTPVFVTGRLRSYSWRDEDQNPHSLVEVQARSVQVLERTQATNGGALDEEVEDQVELEAA